MFPFLLRKNEEAAKGHVVEELSPPWSNVTKGFSLYGKAKRSHK